MNYNKSVLIRVIRGLKPETCHMKPETYLLSGSGKTIVGL